MIKPFIVWFFSCVIFIILSSISNVIPFTQTIANIRLVFLLAIFVIGVLSYLLFLHRLGKHQIGKRHGELILICVAFILIFGFFFSFIKISNSSLFKYKQTAQNPEQVITPTPLITPIDEPVQVAQPQTNTQVSNQIDCVGPDNKIFKTTMAACEKLNRDWGKEPDYMVNCNNCAGGAIWLSKSACNNATCCNGVFMYDRNQCKSNSVTNQGSLIDCFYNGKTFKASANDCMDLKNLNQTINDAKRDINSQIYSDCIAKPFSDFNACTSKCSGQRSYGNDACLESYLGVHPLIENNQQKFDECATEAGNIYSNCFNECAIKKQSELDACK